MRRPGLALRVTVMLVAALLAGTAVLAFSSRGDLEGARRDVDSAWSALRGALDDRYQALAAAGDAVEHRLGAEGALMSDLDEALAAWLAAGGSRERQVAAANRLEGLATRLAGSASATPRLRSSAEVGNALAAVAAVDSETFRTAYNAAVAHYEQVRGGFPRRLVAGALGFDALRTLETSA